MICGLRFQQHEMWVGKVVLPDFNTMACPAMLAFLVAEQEKQLDVLLLARVAAFALDGKRVDDVAFQHQSTSAERTGMVHQEPWSPMAVCSCLFGCTTTPK